MDNQNTSYDARPLGMCVVLILVLMDNQNTPRRCILPLSPLVLILVLMDNQNTLLGQSYDKIPRSLNPCSNG